MIRIVGSAPVAEVVVRRILVLFDSWLSEVILSMHEPRIMALPALCGYVVKQVLPDLRLV